MYDETVSLERKFLGRGRYRISPRRNATEDEGKALGRVARRLFLSWCSLIGGAQGHQVTGGSFLMEWESVAWTSPPSLRGEGPRALCLVLA